VKKPSAAVLIHGGFNREDRCLDDAFKLELSADGATATPTPTGPGGSGCARRGAEKKPTLVRSAQLTPIL